MIVFCLLWFFYMICLICWFEALVAFPKLNQKICINTLERFQIIWILPGFGKLKEYIPRWFFSHGRLLGIVFHAMMCLPKEDYKFLPIVISV